MSLVSAANPNLVQFYYESSRHDLWWYASTDFENKNNKHKNNNVKVTDRFIYVEICMAT